MPFYHPLNRLIIEETGHKTGLKHFRKVLDGRFKIGKGNELIYCVKNPVSASTLIPHQVRLKGTWSVTKNHDLMLTLNKWGRQTFGNELTLKGDVVDVDKNSILFAVTTRRKKNTPLTRILKLQGSWHADRYNRLTFRARKEDSMYDILTLDGIWEVSRSHQIIYRYRKARLIRKKKETGTWIFKGYWDIRGKTRLSYVMDKNSDSVFNFRTNMGVFKENYIKYKVGIGVSRRTTPEKRAVTLFGKWKIKKGIGLIFEVKYENTKPHAIVFGAEARLTDKDTLSFRLRNDVNKDISANLKLSHKILKGDGVAFLKALRSKGEIALFAGAACRW